MSFVVVVDSAADIPDKLAQANGITIVPMPVTINGQTYHEGIDILPPEFYEKFKDLTELPKTSTPNLYTLVECYERLLSTGDEVVAIHLSSGLSSTVSVATMAREMTSQPARVHIVDSCGASFGYGMLALQAAAKIKECSNWPEAESIVSALKQKMRYVFTLNSLEYLVKGGRLSKTAGFVGTLLEIKPLLHLTSDGRIEPFGKVRSRRAAIQEMVDIFNQEAAAGQVVGIAHSDCLPDAEKLAVQLRNLPAVKDIIISDIGCVVGSHTGPGTLALFYQSQ